MNEFFTALESSDPNAELIAKLWTKETIEALTAIATKNEDSKEAKLAKRILKKIEKDWVKFTKPKRVKKMNKKLKYRVELLENQKDWGKQYIHVDFDSREDAEKYMNRINSKASLNTSPGYYIQAIGIDVVTLKNA